MLVIYKETLTVYELRSKIMLSSITRMYVASVCYCQDGGLYSLHNFVDDMKC